MSKTEVDKNGKVKVEIGVQKFGILEELEKSHIYIERPSIQNKA